jgi:CubicO group peptidase (beta-lactamase class C family)
MTESTVRAAGPRRAGPLRLTAAAVCLMPAALAAQVTPYVPPAGEWEHRRPEQMGMSAARIAEAIAFAQSREPRSPRDLEVAHYLSSFAREPVGDALGPFSVRGDPTGLIVRGGYIVAEWGEPSKVDVTFSVAKSFVSTVVGLAWDRRLIANVHEPVHLSMAPVFPTDRPRFASEGGVGPFGLTRALPLFESEHNRRITWDHLLRQTSDWEGTLWGKPDWSDRPSGEPADWMTRARHAPGTVYEYNDVRVNLLALAALNVWRRPLPDVLREYVMDPIGASRTWRWMGYDNSWIILDGVPVQSVSGGSHWGGGLFINAYDQARFGLLTLRDGRWGDRQIVSQEWLDMARTPTPVQPVYGFMNFYLNTGRQRLPAAPESAFFHLGAGTNMVYCDPENDLVIVARWIEGNALNGLVERVLAAIERRADGS